MIAHDCTRLHLHLHQHRKGGIAQLLAPAGRQQQLHLGARSVRQRYLEGLLRRQRQLLQPLGVHRSRVEQNARQSMRLGVVHAGQRQSGALALEDVVADRLIGGRNGRRRIHVRIKVRTIDVVVAAAPQHVAQVAGDAQRLAVER